MGPAPWAQGLQSLLGEFTSMPCPWTQGDQSLLGEFTHMPCAPGPRESRTLLVEFTPMLCPRTPKESDLSWLSSLKRPLPGPRDYILFLVSSLICSLLDPRCPATLGLVLSYALH
jgi:hypothetical protein